MLSESGQPAEAEPLLREALATKAKLLGAGDSEISATRRDLGYALALEGDYSEGEQVLREAYSELRERGDYWSGRERKETLRRLVELSRRTGAAAEVERYQRLLNAEK